MQTLTRGQVRS